MISLPYISLFFNTYSKWNLMGSNLQRFRGLWEKVQKLLRNTIPYHWRSVSLFLQDIKGPNETQKARQKQPFGSNGQKPMWILSKQKFTDGKGHKIQLK